jgi:acetolactate synthase-1/2/3 large subunit
MLVVSPGPEADRAYRPNGWLHLTKDQHGMADAVFGESVRAETPAGALEAVNLFLLGWRTGRDRLPMHLEVPASMFATHVSADVVDALPWHPAEAQSGGVLSASDFDRLIAAIGERSDAPSYGVIVGRGAAGAGAEISAFAARFGALVVETGEGKGIVQPPPAGYLGAAMEFAEATSVVFERDVVLVVGSALGLAEAVLPRDTRSAFVVRIGDEWLERNANLVPDLAFRVDAADLFSRLTDALAPHGAIAERAASVAADVRSAITAVAPAYVQRLVALMAGVMGANPIVVGDNSQICYLGIAPLLSGVSAGGYLNSFGYCTLGYAVPAGIGAAIGTSRPVICVTGDGALLFSIPELMTAAEQRMPLAVVVVDNAGYGEIRDEMIATDIAPLGVGFTLPDLGMVARGFGSDFVDMRELDRFRDIVEQAWAADRPTVIRIGVDVLEACG